VTRLDGLHHEVLRRLRALGVVHPERTVHLTIDIAHHGAALPVQTVLGTLEDLREQGRVVRVGGGWCLADAPAANGAAPPGGAASTGTVWLVVVGGATVLSVHASEAGARARVADLDNFAARVERRRVED
jgi:hypothetical protein